MKRYLVTLLLVLIAPAAMAVPIKWEFVDAQFFDLTFITGTFVFDADTMLVSDVQVSTEDGFTVTCANVDCIDSGPGSFPVAGPISGTDYDLGSAPPANPIATSFFLDTGGIGLGGTPLLFLQLVSPLTNAGGEIALADAGLTVEFICDAADASCNMTFDPLTVGFRSTLDGGFVRSVPEPSTLALLGAGLIGLFMRRKRVA